MAKINFSKVEQALDKTLQAISIEHLTELAAIASILQQTKISPETMDKIIKRFQHQLQKLKRHDLKLYERLALSSEDESRFNLSFADFNQDDWSRLSFLKIKIDELKKELYGQVSVGPEDEKRIADERIRHINKRFNIREGWLPLQ